MQSSTQLPEDKAVRAKITIIGDSIIDNKPLLWPGEFVNYLLDRIGIKRTPLAKRIEKSRNVIDRRPLAVAEHLVKFMPTYEIKNYASDGFTTTNMLNGAYRDRRPGRFKNSLYPHEYVQPIDDANYDLASSQYIILSAGANNIAEFIDRAKAIENDKERIAFIMADFPATIDKLKIEYKEIIAKISKANPNAKLILITPPYPALMQGAHSVYELMCDIGHALNIGNNPNDPTDVIHELFKKIYAESINEIQNANIIVADIASSLNPFANENYVDQVEPSHLGGNRITKLLRYIITNDLPGGNAYRINAPNVEQVALAKWQPKHPFAFVDITCHDYLNEIDKLKQQANVNEQLKKAVNAVYVGAYELMLTCKDKEEIEALKTSLALTMNALKEPHNAAHFKALENNANNHPFRQHMQWRYFLGALTMLAGILFIVGATLAGTNPYLISECMGGGLLTGCGLGFFYKDPKSAVVKGLYAVVNAKEKPETQNEDYEQRAAAKFHR